MTKEEKKDKMKNRISMALKDPILQQGFEIICKEIAELKEENRQLKNEVEDLTAYCNQIGKIKTDVLKLFEHIIAR